MVNGKTGPAREMAGGGEQGPAGPPGWEPPSRSPDEALLLARAVQGAFAAGAKVCLCQDECHLSWDGVAEQPYSGCHFGHQARCVHILTPPRKMPGHQTTWRCLWGQMTVCAEAQGALVKVELRQCPWLLEKQGGGCQALWEVGPRRQSPGVPAEGREGYWAPTRSWPGHVTLLE